MLSVSSRASKKMVTFKVSRVETTPYDGQKPGTSGLRKKVAAVIYCKLFDLTFFIFDLFRFSAFLFTDFYLIFGYKLDH